MAEHSKFFDSLNPLDPDKVYTAEEFVGYFGKLITDGVMKGEANMLKVETSGSNMNTIVDTGTAFLKAREYENDSKLSLTHEVEALGKSRIDRVVIRLMSNVDYREARAFVKKGVAGTSPIAPPLERTNEVYEISLAQVKVVGGQTYINVADVVDERGIVDICPWAGSKILPSFDDNALAEHMLKNSSATELGHVKLNNTITSSSTSEAATANAVKMVNDKLGSGDVTVPISMPFGLVSESNPVRVGKVGKLITLDGHIQIKSSLSGNFILQLPAGFLPRNITSVTMHRHRGATYAQVPGMVEGSSLMFYPDLYGQMAVNDYVSFNFTFLGKD